MTIYNFSLLNVPFANNAPSNEIDAFPDFNRGLGIAFDQTDGKPEMKGLNGLFQQITTSIVYLKQRGIAEWDAELEYPIGAFVVLNGFLYKATAVNTGKNPTTSQNSWQAWATVSDITVSTNGNLKKTSGNNGSISLEVPTASDTQRGAVRFATATEVANKLNVMAVVTPRNVSDMFVGGFTPNNSLTLPSGHILKWGVVDYTSNPGEVLSNVTFPTAFPNDCLNVQLTRKMSQHGEAGDGTMNLISSTRSGFSASVQVISTNNMSLLRGYTWFAIGY